MLDLDDDGMTKESRIRLHYGGNGRTVDLDQRMSFENCLNGWQVPLQ